MPDQREQPQQTPRNPREPHSRCRRSGVLVNAGEVIVAPLLTCANAVFLGRIWGRLGHEPVTHVPYLCTPASRYGMMGCVSETPDNIKTTPQLLDVVEVLSKSSDPIHGWEIARRAGQEPATVYRILERLRIASWVSYEWGPDTEGVGPRRRLYELTEAGQTKAQFLIDNRKGKQ